MHTRRCSNHRPNVGSWTAFAGPAAIEALAEYRTARAQLAAIDDELVGLGGDTRIRVREISLLEFQIDELVGAELDDPTEDETLDVEEQELADAAGLREAVAQARAVIDGSVADGIGEALAALGHRDPLAAVEARVRALQAEVSDLTQELRARHEVLVDDPARLDAIRVRRQLFRDLGRKYGADLREVIAFRDDAVERLAELRGHDERVAALEAARADALVAVDRAAGRLRAARTAAAEPFAEAVTEHLVDLAMPGAWLGIEIAPGEYGDDGADDVTMMLAANPGESPGPLAKVASGGERSRALLAVRVAAQTRGAVPAGRALVFDEVDAGVGGEAGAAVGVALAGLAETAQVLCVTHLAQVAACAQNQVVVRKGDAGGRTVARAAIVDGEDRVSELSRMLAGVEESDHARRHAEELLARAGAHP